MISKFQKGNRAMGRKGATYTCRSCGRQTRETGHEESNLELCAYCLLEAYLENELSDGVIEQPEFETKLDELQKEYKRGKYAKNEADAKTREIQSSKYVPPMSSDNPTITVKVGGHGLMEVMSLDDPAMVESYRIVVNADKKSYLKITGQKFDLVHFLDAVEYRVGTAFDQPLWYGSCAKAAAKKIRQQLEAK